MYFRISRLALLIFLKIFFRLKVEGQENIPKKGGFILAPNHTSYLDPPVAGTASPRMVTFMAKEELFETLEPVQRELGLAVIFVTPELENALRPRQGALG